MRRQEIGIMIRILVNDRGVALIIVLLMISIIIAITLQLNIASRSEIYEAANLKDGIKLLYIAKSGFYMGEAILLEDDNDFDSFNEDWAKLAQISAGSAVLFDEGYFKLNIEDESGKIQINSLVEGNSYNHNIEDLLIRFLNLPEFDLSEQEVDDIVDAIKDWIDKDDEVTGFGAEDAYYKGLGKPYPCKNGPLDSVEELLTIKGITRDIYYGTDETAGIGKYITIYSSGKININTAPTLILRALASEMTEEMVSDMDDFRRSEENDLSNPSWYKNVTGMAGITIDTGLISTGGAVFKIISGGYLDNMSKKVTGVIERQTTNKTDKILSWKVD
jgi:general secretion pathway protein K